MASGGNEDAGLSAAAIAQWFELLVETSTAAIGVISVAENRYVVANQALLELYGMSRQDVMSTDPFSMALRITHPDDLVAEQKLFAELAVGARKFYRADKRFTRPDGSIRWGRLTLSGAFEAPVEPATVGALKWATLHIIDITEHKLIEETLAHREAEFRHAQKVDALGRLAAGIAHDFNNLLTVITGRGEVLKDAILQPNALLRAPDLLGDVEAILEASERAAGLTAQLLAHGRREAVAPRAFVLSELAEASLRLLRRTLGSHVELEARFDALGAIMADQGQISQVVMNLMLNARDALNDAGHTGLIRLETRDLMVEHATQDAAQHAVPPAGAWVALIVSDNGHGMNAEIQARMFEPFFTTRAERPGMRGNGPGLTTVQRIMTVAGGHLAVESAVGRGTTVTAFFPRVETRPHAASAVPARRTKTAPNTHRVLVIEDEPSVRSLVSTVLLGAHYLVSVARDGAEGLRVVDNDPLPFDLIVTDLVMPQVGGMSLAQQLSRRAKPPRILFISGYSNHSTSDLSPYGALLPKPFTPAQLLAAVEQALQPLTDNVDHADP